MNTSEIKDYIKHNLSQIETAEDIAEALDIHYETLRKTFRNSQGMTLWQYVTIQRVQRAKELLNETDLLCYQVCFTNEITGARVFKNMTGVTMVEYRNMSQEDWRRLRGFNTQVIPKLLTRYLDDNW